MSKPKMSIVGQSSGYTRRTFSPMAHTKPSYQEVGSGVAQGEASIHVATIDFRQMAKDAAKMQEYVANGGKQSESRAGKFIKPSGLFNNRGIGQ